MSAESIARWNAIPMTRPEHDELPARFAGTKRIRDDGEAEDNADVKLDGDESDDDMSLVSRSPSPVHQDQMDIDKYDDYVRGPIREVITVDTKIKSTNKGFEMLSKLGWVEGQPLGLSQDARVDPIPFHVKNDATGLGKTSQDFRMIETTVSQRRGLDSERQRNETNEQRKVREGDVARRVARETEITEVLRPFYCTVCDKQFKNVAQYDEHTNSYAHHHKIRFRDMQNTQRAKQNTPEDHDKRKEKERRREEKELRKIAAAAGVKMAKSTPGAPTLAPVSTSGESKPVGFRKGGGWASLPSVTADSSSETLPGWATVGSSAITSHSPSRAPDAVYSSDDLSMPAISQPHDPSNRDQNQEVQRQLHQSAPAFRTGGWSTIDSTTQTPPLLPPPPPASRHMPASATADMHHLLEQSSSGPPQTRATPPTLAPAVSLPPSALPGHQASPANLESSGPKSFKSKKEREAEMRESARSGWQNFQRGGRRK
ncbi:hypothetical protein B0F90DRAFT_30979 [Multifurca ochricompacta]|uniref:G-patch domain-containing protein n=1 Tax=Multifurca ochricompacta TaxID=376703 RepID=A0AAD4MCG1_9AGAM|nr:hypothetical protein B0F90DRAFT_30979 [Multifurca ochricompacta]